MEPLNPIPQCAECLLTLDWIREDLKVKDDDIKPVVILVIAGETAIYRRGYDLTIADWVERAIQKDIAAGT